MSEEAPGWPDALEVLIEVPRHGLVKRRPDGTIDLISPLPCPFNYGSVPGTTAPDGDPEDALLLGPRRPRGARVRAPVVARVRFRDAGRDDPKWVLSHAPLTPRDRRRIDRFFRFYVLAKRAIHAVRREPGRTAYGGLEAR